ncbi:hypothetical protein NQ317_006836 [Molorchus minor]|uniref:Fatty acid hydroxylase domain-containing protein n=1 Tax=Molorchus minor TaxID=1323400 RepID=A0ABQ9K1R8_9CUCU|nr:hypothetical protein NQ317_006836 [Molorchus minor]
MNRKGSQRKLKLRKHRKRLRMLGEYEDESSSSGGEVTPTRKNNNLNSQNVQQNPSILSSLRSVLIVLSTALICFAAARNSITWHCQRFWGASGDFWQAQWDKFLDTVGEDPFYLWVYGTFLLSFGVYWLFGGIYTIMDVTNTPSAIRGYKIQPGTNEPVDTRKLLKGEIETISNPEDSDSDTDNWDFDSDDSIADKNYVPSNDTSDHSEAENEFQDDIEQDNFYCFSPGYTVKQVIWCVLVNQLIVGIPSSVLMYYAMKWRGYPPLRELPTFHWVLYELAVHILTEEAAFYYSHRFLHSRYLYKYIHKQHHEWTAPIAVTAIYCNPIEHIFSNLFPPFLGVFIMGSHVATAWLWFTLAILSTLNAHSGYHLPFFPSPEAHDFHHLKFNNCFGVLGVLDRLHGTDTNFRQTRAYVRHIMMLSFIPPREAFPEPSTCKHKLGKR